MASISPGLQNPEQSSKMVFPLILAEIPFHLIAIFCLYDIVN